jgi:hypothetical protein
MEIGKAILLGAALIGAAILFSSHYQLNDGQRLNTWTGSVAHCVSHAGNIVCE